MIFFDTETTGLLGPGILPLDKQPEIIEFAAIKTDKDLNEIARMEFLCKPDRPIPKYLTEKVHKISNEDVKDKEQFVYHFSDLVHFFLGEIRLVAHNAQFDVGMLKLELTRLGLENKFPWPTLHICTMDTVESVGTFKSKALGNVYEDLFDEEIPDAHRAMVDVEALIRVYKELNK